MGFSINHKQAGSTFEPLPEGWYEVFPTEYDINTSQNGNEMAVFNYLVRDDVEQEGAGRKIKFDRFVATEAAMWRIQAASKASKIEDGKDFPSLKEWAEEFKGRPIRVKLGFNTYTNRQGNEVTVNDVKAFEESYQGGRYVEQPDTDAPQVDDEDLPF